MRIRCRVDPRPVNSDPAAAAKWDAIIGSCVLVRRALLYSSRGRYEIIPRDSRFINMLDAHRLPFTWTMFAPSLIISLRAPNRFTGLTDRVIRKRREISRRFARLRQSGDDSKTKERERGREKMKDKKKK